MADFSACLPLRGSPAFPGALKTTLLGLPPGSLPLHAAVSQGGQVDDSDLDATVLDVTDDGAGIHARIGVFFSEVVGNCACGDEPFPAPAYCVLQTSIDTATGRATFSVPDEQ